MTLVQTAIAFVTRHPAVTSAIVGPRTMEHQHEHAGRRVPPPVDRAGARSAACRERRAPPGCHPDGVIRVAGGRGAFDVGRGDSPVRPLAERVDLGGRLHGRQRQGRRRHGDDRSVRLRQRMDLCRPHPADPGFPQAAVRSRRPPTAHGRRRGGLPPEDAVRQPAVGRHQRPELPELPRRRDSALHPQQGPPVGRRQHAAQQLTQRSCVLPAPLQPRPALGPVAAVEPGRVSPEERRPARTRTT